MPASVAQVLFPGRQGRWRPDVNANRAKRMHPCARPPPGSPTFSFPLLLRTALQNGRPGSRRSRPAPREGPLPRPPGEAGGGRGARGSAPAGRGPCPPRSLRPLPEGRRRRTPASRSLRPPGRTHGSGLPGRRMRGEAAAVAPRGPCPGRPPPRGPPPPRAGEAQGGAGRRLRASSLATSLGGGRDGSPVRSHLLERSMRTPEKSFSPSRNETTRASSMM